MKHEPSQITVYRVNIFTKQDETLPPSLRDERGIYNLFVEFGEINKVKVFTPKNKEGPTNAYCCFVDLESAKNAVESISGITVEGVELDCRKKIRCVAYNEKTDKEVKIKIPRHTSKEVLQRHLSRFGEVESIKGTNNKNSVIVRYSSSDSANKCRQLKKCLTIKDKELYEGIDQNVDESKSKFSFGFTGMSIILFSAGIIAYSLIKNNANNK